jgi:hypothetical protein
MILAVIMYYVSKRIFIKEQSKMKFTPDSVFEEIINKTTRTFLSSSNNLQNILKKPLMRGNSFVSHTKDHLLNLMKEAYIHPAEKNMTSNPIHIWNDSYNFIKRSEQTPETTQKDYIEYEQIIKREVGHNGIRTDDFIEQIL